MLSNEKEIVEIELSYLIEKALFAFEGDAREKLSTILRETSNQDNSMDKIYDNFTELMNKMVVHF